MQQTVEMPNALFLPEVGRRIAEGHTVVIACKGRSMRPFLENERDKVKLTKCDAPKVGDAVLAEIAKGHFVLHRVINIDGDVLTLQGDGNVRGTEKCRRDNVMGRVVEYIYPDHVTMADDAHLVRRIKLWRMARPVRRYLLFVYRKINRAK